MSAWKTAAEGFDVWHDEMHPDDIPYHCLTLAGARRLAKRLARKFGAAWVCSHCHSSDNAREVYSA